MGTQANAREMRRWARKQDPVKIVPSKKGAMTILMFFALLGWLAGLAAFAIVHHGN